MESSDHRVSLLQQDAWKYIRGLDTAFLKLRRRAEARGV
jgi:hypothetical protein